MRVSVIIPAYNEDESVGPLLESICSSTYGEHRLHEVLVYDDASTDATASITAALAARFPAIRLIRGARRVGGTGAVECLLKAARGDVILQVNADTVLCDGAIGHLADAIEGGAALAIGANEPVLTHANVPALASAFSYDIVARLKAGPHRRHYAVANLVAFERDALEGVDFPRGLINYDHYLAMHVFKRGGRIVNVPEARCLLKPAGTFTDYWRTSRRVLEGERQLRRHYGFESTPLLAVLGAIAVSAVRKPVSAVCWALLYCWSSARRSPTKDSAWPMSESTKGRIA